MEELARRYGCGVDDHGRCVQLLRHPALYQNEDDVNGSAEFSSPSGPVAILSVALREAAHDNLERALSLGSKRAWFNLQRARSLESAAKLVRDQIFSVVVSERDLGSDTWLTLLHGIAHLSRTPSLIVTSRLADEYLWAEALNLGAYDVLAQPYDSGEVTRVVIAAWRNWEARPAVARAAC
jgi:DNA-binding NtrC family response regulator